MKQQKTYGNYPCWIMLISNIVSFSTYLIGAFIIYPLGIIWLCVYLLYILLLEIRVMKVSCVSCYYYGKCCAFGKGKISALLFNKDNHNKFAEKKICWKDIMPDFLASLIPLIVGTILLILNFSWLLLILIISLIMLASFGNGFIRSSLACKHCKQRVIGCPAEQLFNKNKK